MSMTFSTYLATDYNALRTYLGEVRFNALAAECDQSQWTNIRSLSSKLPEKLARLPQMPPELCEIATLERALRNALEAADMPPPRAENHKNFQLHPSVNLLTFTQNSVSIWSSLKCGEPPPRPYKLSLPQHVLVWRHNAHARMRLLGEEEFAALTSIRKTSDNFDKNYLNGWLETEVLIDASRHGTAK
jgi:hypothetical protein